MTSRVDYGEQVDLLGGGSNGLTISSGGQVLIDDPGTLGAPGLSFVGDEDTGWFKLSLDSLSVTAGGTEMVRYVTTPDQVLIGPDGVVANPGIANNSDADTGIYWPTTNALGLVSGGVEMLRLAESINDQVMLGPTGTETAPAFTFITDNDTGIFNLLGDVIQITCAGSEVARFTPAGIETTVVGTAGAPSITLATDDDTGIFFQATASDQISLTAGGVELLRLTEGDAVQSFLRASNAVSADTVGGALLLEAGDGNGTGNGGNTTINAGTGGTSAGGGGGAISLNGGNAGVGSGTSGGNANFIAGDGDGSGAGGIAFVSGGDGGATNADGGNATVAGGDATGTGTGGNVELYTGATGTGDPGDVVFFTGGFPSGEEFARFKGATATTASAGLTTILTIPTLSDRSYSFEILGLGREDDAVPTGETITKRIFGGAENTGGTLALLPTVADRADTGGAAVDWDITVGISATNIIIQVDDGGTETVDWKVHVKLVDHT